MKTVRLSECIERLESGKRPKGGVSKITNGVPSLGAEHISEYGTISYLNIRYIPDSFYRSMNKGRIRKGDVLLVKDGATTGRVAYVDESFRFESAAINEHVFILRPKEDFSGKLIFHVIRSEIGQRAIEENFRGGAQGGINQDFLSNIKFDCPSELDKQVEIADEIQSQLARVEIIRQAALKQKEAAKALQSAILREVFPWQAGESLPSGWKWEKITDISKNLDGKRIPVTEKVRKKGDIPYYGASGIVDYVQDYLFDEELLLVSEDGANLVMRTYPIAFSISGKTWVNNHAHVLKFEDKNTQKIVQHYINGLDISDYVSGAAQPKLNQENLNRIKIPVPIDANAKLEVVKKIEQTFEISTKMTKQADTQLNAIEALPAAILREAFNFKINEN